jgi:hypothetical protein
MTTHRIGWLVAMLVVGACSDPEPDPITVACEKRCSEQAACCPLGGCAMPTCQADCARLTQDLRKQCRADVDEYVSCARSAPTWSCEQDSTQPQGISARPDGCEYLPAACCATPGPGCES